MHKWQSMIMSYIAQQSATPDSHIDRVLTFTDLHKYITHLQLYTTGLYSHFHQIKLQMHTVSVTRQTNSTDTVIVIKVITDGNGDPGLPHCPAILYLNKSPIEPQQQ